MSPSGEYNRALLYTLRFYLFYPLFIAYTFYWIVYECYCYSLFASRPAEMYIPLNYFSRLLIPQFPSTVYFYSVALAGLLAATFILLQNRNNTLARIVLFFVVIWLNAFHWSFGFASHVGHIFMLFHFLTLFIPHEKTQSHSDTLYTAKMIRWFLFGITLIYVWSAIWKVVTLVYKIIFQPEAMNWLHILAAPVNAVSGHFIMEETLGVKAVFFAVPEVWPVLFVCMVLFMLASCALVFRPQLVQLVFTVFLLFHIINFLVTRAEFIVAPTIYLIFLCCNPVFYKKLWNKSALTFSGTCVKEDGVDHYTRRYENGDTEDFKGIYAIREYQNDHHKKWYTSLLYLIGK